MKKVVDASVLRPPSPVLERYLTASSDHFVVFTDYAAMESFKGRGEINLPRSLGILRRFPRQVLVLKSTEEIARLRPRAKGLQGRMIDVHQTAGFAQWCEEVLVNRRQDPWVTLDLRMKSQQANAHFEFITRGTERIRQGIELMFQSYPKEGLRALRKREPVSDAIHERIVRDIMNITAVIFRDSIGITKMPRTEDALHSFQFRYALCAYLLVLKWFADGGHQSTPTSKLRNDFTDMTYAAYATFFDGILTEDRKLTDVHAAAVWALKNVFR